MKRCLLGEGMGFPSFPLQLACNEQLLWGSQLLEKPLFKELVNMLSRGRYPLEMRGKNSNDLIMFSC